MRFATYNIRHGAPPDRRADHRGLSTAVAALDADVVALQEVDRRVVRSCFRDQAAVAARAAGLQHHFARARSLGPFGRYGNALLLPSGPVQTSVLRLRSRGEPRVALFARLRAPGTFVTVVSVHLQNSSGPGPGEAPDQLDQLLAELSHWPEPWVVMGDLNLRPDVVLPRLRAAGLEAAETGPTFPSDEPTLRIDWVGVRGMRIRSAEAVRCTASDHLPIVVELDPVPAAAVR